MKYIAILAILFVTMLNAGESASYNEGIALLKKSQSDHAQLIPAIKALTKAVDEVGENDPKSSEIMSCLYWARKKLTMNDFKLLESNAPIMEKVEKATAVIPTDKAAEMLMNADAFALKADALLAAIKYFEIADRFADTPEGKKAMSQSLAYMQKVGTEKLTVYKPTTTDGKAYITSVPVGASIIWISPEGNKDTGYKTPSLITLPKGSQKLELNLKGFKCFETSVEIGQNIVKPDAYKLDPIGVLMDIVYDAGWTVFVDGKMAKTIGSEETPCSAEIPLGRHILALAKDGFNDIQFPVEVTENGVKNAKGKYENKLEVGIKAVAGAPTLNKYIGKWKDNRGTWIIDSNNNVYRTFTDGTVGGNWKTQGKFKYYNNGFTIFSGNFPTTDLICFIKKDDKYHVIRYKYESKNFPEKLPSTIEFDYILTKID